MVIVYDPFSGQTHDQASVFRPADVIRLQQMPQKDPVILLCDPVKTGKRKNPGCQLAGSDPRYVTRTYEWLRSKKPDAAIWMTCCGAPAEWAGEVDIHAAHLEEMRRQLERAWRTDSGFSMP